MQQLDYSLFEVLNSLAGYKLVAVLAIFFGVYGIYLIAAVIIGYWFIAKERIRARSTVILSLISFIIARGILTELIRLFWARNRPFVGHEVVQVISKGPEASFPSGHASAMFALAAVVYGYNRKLGTWLLLLAAISGIARVIIGVHYPGDVLAGAILGGLVAYFVVKFFGKKISKISQFFSELSDKLLPFTKAK